MSRPVRRPSSQQQYQQQPQQYAAVPQSPANQHQLYASRSPARSPSAGSSNNHHKPSGRGAIAMGVATGAIGGGYGPYSYNPNQAKETGVYNNAKFSATPSETSVVTPTATHERAPINAGPTSSVPLYMLDRDPDLDDALHNPDSTRGQHWTLFSGRGWANVGAIFVLIIGLITLFIGYPVIFHYTHLPGPIRGFNVGGINATGQIPDLSGLPSLIDSETPQSAMSHTGIDGKKYDLVFSDEFNTDGRTFYPGDDAFWEAVDLHYWPTGDFEWYDPSAVTTQDGKLVITMTEERNHDLNFMSGMLQSWNKFCFNTGYVEVSVSMPGSPSGPGLWPGAWSMGNLGRAGYGATTEGMWPYTYDSCDLGTFPNQTMKDGTPTAAAGLSFLPGQRLSACTCPGSDHPGPETSTGRGVPEVDIFETQVDTDLFQGQVSQSLQCAPYNAQYVANTSAGATTVYDNNLTSINTYMGGIFQQAVSAVTFIDNSVYNNQSYATYAYELWSNPSNRDESYVTWFSNGQKTWTATSATIGPDPVTNIGQRLISEEPMYLIFNLGMAHDFQAQDFKHMTFPASMYVDYVRVYQRQGIKNGVTCDPPNRPTADYINKHITAYTNPNLTTWIQAGNTFPRNSLYDGC